MEVRQWFKTVEYFLRVVGFELEPTEFVGSRVFDVNKYPKVTKYGGYEGDTSDFPDAVIYTAV